MPRWDIQVSLNRQEAICSGKETYQGTPCKHGHPGIRYVKWNGKCFHCHEEGRSSYYGENREKVQQKYRDNPQLFLFRAAKQRARKYDREFDIELEDVEIPERCPISGRPLVVCSPDAPSIDRINSAEGYTKGNIAVISKRMNAIKNALTLEELKKLVTYMETAELLK